MGRLFRLTPWRRAPLLLLRRPAVALALAAAALVAALPAAAAPLFLSSAQHATLHRQIDTTCQTWSGVQIIGPVAPSLPGVTRQGQPLPLGIDRYHGRQQLLAEHPVPGLAAPTSSGYADVNVSLTDRPLPLPDLPGVRVLGRDGFADEVEVLAGPSGSGIWLPHEYAERQGIEVGDQLVITRRSRDPAFWSGDDIATHRTPDSVGTDVEVPLPVAAIYRDLRSEPVSPYWCGVEFVYAGTSLEQADPDAVILPTALVDVDTLLAIGETTRSELHQVIDLELTNLRLTTPAAARLAADIDELQNLLAAHPDLFPSSRFDQTEFVSYLDRYQRRAALVRTGLLPPVLPVTIAGTLIGLAVAAAGAVFWTQRRRHELVVLATRGVGPAGLGWKAVLESAPAVLVGTIGGWAAAWALVAGIGPSPVLAPGTMPTAAALAALTGLLALGLIGVVAAAGTRGLADARPASHRAGWWSRLPWELALLAAAPLAWQLLSAGEVADELGGAGTVVHVPARLLVTPILLILGTAILAARLLSWWLRRQGHRRSPAAPVRLLAWRRAVRSAATTAVLIAATATPVAMATFAATTTDSIHTTADATLRFRLGADTVISYPHLAAQFSDGQDLPPPVPDTLADRTTEVLWFNQQRMNGLHVDVAAVDPDTFLTGAFWDSRIPGPDLAAAVSRLTADDPPTVLVSRRIEPGPATLWVQGRELPVQVANVQPIPGARPSYPLVLIHREALERAIPRSELTAGNPQLWIHGDSEQALAELTDAHLMDARVNTVDQHRVGAVYEPVTYTFQYLIALSVFTGLIGAVGLLLHLESRTAAHRRAYVMLRRLGLPAGAHRRALLLEVGTPLLAGLAGGLTGALGISALLRAGLDVQPDRYPDAVLVLPIPVAVTVTAVVVLFGLVSGLLTHRRIHTANPAEVLRDAT